MLSVATLVLPFRFARFFPMPKRFTASAAQLKPDPRFDSVLASKFVNCLMHDGKKSIAQRVFYNALDVIGERVSGEEPIEVFTQAVENVKPAIEVRSKRVGGATYQVPVEVTMSRRTALSIRWLIINARSRGGRSMADKLCDEILDAYNNAGGAVKKKEDVHRMAEANKAFAHYRW